jgi:aminoglycoside 2'-N-acetyltransferase I
MALTVERVETASLSPQALSEVRSLCAEAYGEDMTQYFEDIGPGVHLLGWDGPTLATHAMWVRRVVYPGTGEPVDCAYVELVATRVRSQRRGLASQVMRRLAREVQSCDLAALSPSFPPFYQRLGWEVWRGPLRVRTRSGVGQTPDEQVMVLHLPRTPRDLDLDGMLTVAWRPGEIW